MAHIILDKQALFHNLDLIAKKAGGKEKVAIVLKDNAYGHGLREIAALAQEYGINKAVVRNFKEAQSISQYFPYILVLSDIPKEAMEFNFAINELVALQHFPKGSKVELKIDTGMHRNGIKMEEISEALEIIKKKSLNLAGVFTHFRSADELSSELFWQQSNWQEAKKKILQKCKALGFEKPRFHAANSAALFRLGCEDDFARVGIAMYGYLEMDEVFEAPRLKPVLSLWAKRVARRKMKKGDRIGYGGDFEAKADMEVATYDCGYGDGIFRSLKSIKDGKILGRVSMDYISVASSKDEICIFDDAKKVARELGTISYEVLVKLSPYIPREVK